MTFGGIFWCTFATRGLVKWSIVFFILNSGDVDSCVFNAKYLLHFSYKMSVTSCFDEFVLVVLSLGTLLGAVSRYCFEQNNSIT